MAFQPLTARATRPRLRGARWAAVVAGVALTLTAVAVTPASASTLDRLEHLTMQTRQIAGEVQLAREVQPNQYHQRNLVSDQPGHAELTDPNLVNAWGMSAGPDTPVWVSDNGTDVATLYSGAVNDQPITKMPLVVSIPGGAPTGQVFNPTDQFVVRSGMAQGPARFIFASEAGIISAWNPNVPPPSPSMEAQVEAMTPDAVYKGLALADTVGGPHLYAANFHAGTIDVFDSSFRRVQLFGSFTDPDIPAGFAPFNVQAIDGFLVVTYAKQDAAREDDVKGPGNGFVDLFTPSGFMIRRLVSHGALNSPWGVALAPGGFGRFSGSLLIGNFGDGHIHAYSLFTGTELGQLRNEQGQPIVIDGLWALRFGNGVTGERDDLLFSAGPDDESHGLFGVITFQGRHQERQNLERQNLERQNLERHDLERQDLERHDLERQNQVRQIQVRHNQNQERQGQD